MSASILLSAIAPVILVLALGSPGKNEILVLSSNALN